jgi:hypothetical protein
MCLDAMTGAQWFSTFDLRSSYHQVEVAPEDRDKTAFICREGMYRYVTMPFGLCNAAATFQRLMDVILAGISYEICLVYIDDVIVFSDSLEQHLERLRTVLGRIRNAGLKLKPAKSFLMQKSVGFLGHLVTTQGICAHPEKTAAVTEWPTPTCVRDVRAFVGFASYYRRFVRNFSAVAAPLTALMSPKTAFHWGEAQEAAFRALKKR